MHLNRCRNYPMLRRLPLLLFFTAMLCSLSCLSADTQPPSYLQGEIDALDAEINTLTQSLQKLRTEALSNEIDAQPLLFDNWDQFANKIEANEEDEKKILKLKKEIDALKDKKRALEHTQQKK